MQNAALKKAQGLLPFSTSVPEIDPFVTARQRAFVLAASGNYLLWPNIAQVLADEGFSAAAIKKVGKDREAQHLITALIHAAIASNPSSPSETWRHREPETKAKLKP
jgi:hypothetical protein